MTPESAPRPVELPASRIPREFGKGMDRRRLMMIADARHETLRYYTLPLQVGVR